MKIISEIKKSCKELNKNLPCKNRDEAEAFNQLLEEAISKIPGGKIYWSAELWKDSQNDATIARETLLYKDSCQICPSDDFSHHPGLCVKYKK